MTREEAIHHIMDVITENNSIAPNMVTFDLEKQALYMAIEALKQPEIIRCIECKHAKSVDSHYWIRCELSNRYELHEWYCPSARRRDE